MYGTVPLSHGLHKPWDGRPDRSPRQPLRSMLMQRLQTDKRDHLINIERSVQSAGQSSQVSNRSSSSTRRCSRDGLKKTEPATILGVGSADAHLEQSLGDDRAPSESSSSKAPGNSGSCFRHLHQYVEVYARSHTSVTAATCVGSAEVDVSAPCARTGSEPGQWYAH